MLKKSLVFEAVRVAEINVFDFDDTLVKTKSYIYLTTKEGRSIAMTPGEYAVYEPQTGDVFDYSEFDELKSPTPIAHMLLKLKYAIRNLGIDNVFILTARGAGAPIQRFLKELGIDGIQVIALGNSDPSSKAAVIKGEILRRGIKLVKFFDDSAKNVAAVKSLRFDPEMPNDVQIISIKV